MTKNLKELKTATNTRSAKIRSFGSLLTKFYFSKVVQRWLMKQGVNPHVAYLRTVTNNVRKSEIGIIIKNRL